MALYMPHRATLNDEIFAGGRKRRRRGTWRARKEIVGRGKQGALKYCSGPLLPRLLRRFYGRVEQWRIPDVSLWPPPTESEEKRRKERKMLKGIRRGRRRGEGRREGKVRWKSWCTRRVTITRRWLHGPLCKDNGVGTRTREKGKECGTFARESLGRKSAKTRAKGRAFFTRYCRSRD